MARRIGLYSAANKIVCDMCARVDIEMWHQTLPIGREYWTIKTVLGLWM